MAQLRAQVKKRGISKTERIELLERIGTLLREKEEARKNRDPSELLPVTKAVLEKARTELERQAAAKQNQEQ